MDKDNSVFRKMDAKIKEIAELEIMKDKVDKLICFSGIDITIAVKTDGGKFMILQDLQLHHCFVNLRR